MGPQGNLGKLSSKARTHTPNQPVEDTGISSKTRPTNRHKRNQLEPTKSDQTKHGCVKKTQNHHSQQQRAKIAHVTAQEFLRTNKNWRSFKLIQYQELMQMKRDQNLIKEMEAQVQREWQSLTMEALNMLDKIVKKYCRR